MLNVPFEKLKGAVIKPPFLSDNSLPFGEGFVKCNSLNV